VQARCPLERSVVCRAPAPPSHNPQQRWLPGRELSRTPAGCGQSAKRSGRSQVGRSRRRRCRLQRGFEPLRGEDPRWLSSRPVRAAQRREQVLASGDKASTLSFYGNRFRPSPVTPWPARLIAGSPSHRLSCHVDIKSDWCII
jgi:hypothetical protein